MANTTNVALALALQRAFTAVDALDEDCDVRGDAPSILRETLTTIRGEIHSLGRQWAELLTSNRDLRAMASDLVQQRDAARRNWIEIEELLGCVENDDGDALAIARAMVTRIADLERAAKTSITLVDYGKRIAPRLALLAEVLAAILADRNFFDSEDSEKWCELLAKFGYVERVIYDPELHGEIDNAESGFDVWIFTDAMRAAAKGGTE